METNQPAQLAAIALALLMPTGGAPIKLRLDSLSTQKSRSALRCADGKTIKAEPYALQPDA
jgi:hypothetical protein